MPVNIGNKKCKLYIGNTKIRKGYLGTKKIYSCGNIVTYYVDSGVSYTEEVDEDETCLSPKTFTPAKSGWEFVGWRQDKTASGSVLSGLAMNDTPVTLYAVFRQAVTISYNGNSNTGGTTVSQVGYKYYNNASTVNPTFTLQANGFTKDEYAFSKWALGDIGGTQYDPGTSITLSANTTMYAVWVASSVDAINDNKYVTYDDQWSSASGKPIFSVIARIHHELVGTTNPKDDIATLAITLGEYKKATIIVSPYVDNTTAWWEPTRYAQCYINGELVVDSKNENSNNNIPRTYTYTSDTTMTFSGHAQIVGDNDGKETSCSANFRIESITLSM